MELTYYKNDNGSISIENIDSLKEYLGKRYTTYYLCSLSEAKRRHRKQQDLENVIIDWIEI